MSTAALPKIGRERYKRELRALQIELVKFQRDVIADNKRVLIIIEGRDAAGKDGRLARPDRAVVFPYEAAAHQQGLIAP